MLSWSSLLSYYYFHFLGPFQPYLASLKPPQATPNLSKFRISAKPFLLTEKPDMNNFNSLTSAHFTFCLFSFSMVLCISPPPTSQYQSPLSSLFYHTFPHCSFLSIKWFLKDLHPPLSIPALHCLHDSSPLTLLRFFLILRYALGTSDLHHG